MIFRDQKRCPTHPGELLRDDILPCMDYSKTQLAKMLGISRQHFYDILNEKKPVSAPVAARLGKMFGNGSLFWIRMQGAHDAWHAEREIDVSQVPTLDVA
ncbi:HigA family addiction module antitoxin [Actibacterium sp. D379-3]|jgi:addiction module HigA family antidote|nr:HigA family addiction module antitoxin [bacterium]